MRTDHKMSRGPCGVLEKELSKFLIQLSTRVRGAAAGRPHGCAPRTARAWRDSSQRPKKRPHILGQQGHTMRGVCRAAGKPDPRRDGWRPPLAPPSAEVACPLPEVCMSLEKAESMAPSLAGNVAKLRCADARWVCRCALSHHLHTDPAVPRIIRPCPARGRFWILATRPQASHRRRPSLRRRTMEDHG